ncbi:MAG: YbaB/EbfC family nucleoid-associated protein [Rhizobiales bacterium]|nr:YbaB/EbfC family nucleoid-associated protein [Hyphomicrobiales bacterium]
MKDIMGMMNQMRGLQERMQTLQAELAAAEVSGSAGGGLVTVRLNGKGDMRGLTIDPSLVKPEDVEVIEDLILAAHQDAKSRVEAMMQSKMQELTGGLPLPPGLKLF